MPRHFDVKKLKKEEIIVLYTNLKIENYELRSRINKLISILGRKEYHKDYYKNNKKKK